jgi:hypothetical protein
VSIDILSILSVSPPFSTAPAPAPVTVPGPDVHSTIVDWLGGFLVPEQTYPRDVLPGPPEPRSVRVELGPIRLRARPGRATATGEQTPPPTAAMLARDGLMLLFGDDDGMTWLIEEELRRQFSAADVVRAMAGVAGRIR